MHRSPSAFGFIATPHQEKSMPSKPDKVSIGLSSVLGSLGVLGAAALAVISFVNGDQSSETIGAMAAGVAVLVGLMHVRGKQAVAITEAAAKVFPIAAPVVDTPKLVETTMAAMTPVPGSLMRDASVPTAPEPTKPVRVRKARTTPTP